MLEAQAALEAANAQLEAAELALANARHEVADAKSADEQARRSLEAALQAERKVRREIVAVLARMGETRDTLGAVARDAYQGGSFATLSVVLDADTPSEFADRYVGMRTVMRAGDSALGSLAVEHAELANKEERLQALREQQERLRREAQAALGARTAAEQAAADAEQRLATIVDKSEAALVAAEEARLADYERYQAFLAQATAVGQNIRDWSTALRASTSVVDGTGAFIRPGTGQVTSQFGPRLHPILGYVKLHTGMDLGRGDGYVYAADGGTVVTAGFNTAYGNMAVIDHGTFGGSQLATLYAHQSTMFVRAGDAVVKGQRIGRIGSTGYSTGPHLHFEVRIDGAATDPWPWIVDAPLPRTVRD